MNRGNRICLDSKGFSLVELIIVIAVMVILAGALAPALIKYIEANCRRDLGALMEQLERPYITRLNTSAFLARAMERYLFSEGERTVGYGA